MNNTPFSLPLSQLFSRKFLSALVISGFSVAGDLLANNPFPHQYRTDLSKVYFYEDFRNYGVTVPNVVREGIKYRNDPIHHFRAQLDVELAGEGAVFLKPISTPAKKDYDILFQFRLRAGDDKQVGAFETRLAAGGGEIIVAISQDGITVSSNGLTPAVQAKGSFSNPIEVNRWHHAVLTVRNGVLSVYVDENRVMREVAKVVLPKRGIAGVNFHGKPASPFSLTEILVRDPAPLPDFAITNLLPAPRKVDTSRFEAGASRTVPANDRFGATVQTGSSDAGITVSWKRKNGGVGKLTFKTADLVEKTKNGGDSAKATETVLPDAIIRVSGLKGKKAPLDYYIRPMLRRYRAGEKSRTDTYYDIIRDWELLPKASEHPLRVEARRTAKGVDLYLDCRYVGPLEDGEIEELTFTASPNAAVGPVFSEALPASARESGGFARFLPLETAALGKARSFADARLSLKPGLSEVEGIPLFVATGEGSADVGLVREGQGTWALECDEYLSRSPFDGLLTEVHFSVPGGVLYHKAWVLCAVDPDPKKDPILTTRLVAYERKGGAAGNLLADTTLVLPRKGEKPGKGVIPVGTVTRKGKDGKKVEVPLYLVAVPINVGRILDESMLWPRLSLDFIGKTLENYQQVDKTIKPDPRSVSAVQIFGVTLEKSPVALDFRQSQPGNVFHNDEKPETTAILKAFAPAKGTLVWEILDAAGKKVGGGAQPFQFAKEGEESHITLPLTTTELGWYRLNVSLRDEAGREILTHPASFARLGKDERKAKEDSPYGTWVWNGTHGTIKDPAIEGPLLFKAGIRQAHWTKVSADGYLPYPISKAQVKVKFKFADMADPEKREAFFKTAEETINKALTAYPHIREYMIFHESGPGYYFPHEVLGVKPVLTEKEIARQKRYADVLNAVGKFVREKFPHLKTIVGNSGNSAMTLASALRHGGNVDYVDTIGIETPVQAIIPEKFSEWTLHGYQITRDLVRILTGRDIPANGSVEFTYRNERDIGPLQQAQWYVRDMLISHAYGYSTIAPSSLTDVSAPYYSTYWGACGLMERGPYAYPKMAYVAYATLTNVLDQVVSRRQIPTGSRTVYALEMERKDGKRATALWAARGDAEFNLEFDGDTTVRITEMDGKTREEKTKDGKLLVKGGTSPVYTLTDTPVKGVTLGKRSFPKDEARAKHSEVAVTLGDLEQVELDLDNSMDVSLEAEKINQPVWKAGVFDLRGVHDNEKGACLELELKTSASPNLNKYITEYTTIRLKEPVVVKGSPAALGVWVKGNSNWGRVMFEIEDAQGEVWRSTGTGGWGCDILDWPGNIAVNFDGWNFVALPLRDSKLFDDHSAGPVLEQWVSGGGNKKIDYPIKIRALIVEMNRQTIDMTEITPVKNLTIRLKDISGIYDSEL